MFRTIVRPRAPPPLFPRPAAFRCGKWRKSVPFWKGSRICLQDTTKTGHHAEPIRRGMLAKGRQQAFRPAIIPRAAAQHALPVRAIVKILAPLERIAREIINPERVRRKTSHRRRGHESVVVALDMRS